MYKKKFSYSEWFTDSQTIFDQIELIRKEPNKLLFFRGD